jgi:hypothetical protein
VLSLADGGVYDNLGLEWFQGWSYGRPASAEPDFLIVANVGRLLRRTSRVPRSVRASSGSSTRPRPQPINGTTMRLRKGHEAIQAFESDRVAALLEHKTPAEETELFASSAVTLTVLVDAAISKTPLETFDSRSVGPDSDPDPDVLAKVARRIQLRLEHRLPHRECVVEDPERDAAHCRCLTELLDSKESETLTRAGVIRRATKEHKARWRWLKNKPAQRPEPVSRPEPPPPTPRPIPRPGGEPCALPDPGSLESWKSSSPR